MGNRTRRKDASFDALMTLTYLCTKLLCVGRHLKSGKTRKSRWLIATIAQASGEGWCGVGRRHFPRLPRYVIHHFLRPRLHSSPLTVFFSKPLHHFLLFHNRLPQSDASIDCEFIICPRFGSLGSCCWHLVCQATQRHCALCACCSRLHSKAGHILSLRGACWPSWLYPLRPHRLNLTKCEIKSTSIQHFSTASNPTQTRKRKRQRTLKDVHLRSCARD